MCLFYFNAINLKKIKVQCPFKTCLFGTGWLLDLQYYCLQLSQVVQLHDSQPHRAEQLSDCLITILALNSTDAIPPFTTVRAAIAEQQSGGIAESRSPKLHTWTQHFLPPSNPPARSRSDARFLRCAKDKQTENPGFVHTDLANSDLNFLLWYQRKCLPGCNRCFNAPNIQITW